MSCSLLAATIPPRGGVEKHRWNGAERLPHAHALGLLAGLLAGLFFGVAFFGVEAFLGLAFAGEAGAASFGAGDFFGLSFAFAGDFFGVALAGDFCAQNGIPLLCPPPLRWCSSFSPFPVPWGDINRLLCSLLLTFTSSFQPKGKASSHYPPQITKAAQWEHSDLAPVTKQLLTIQSIDDGQMI
jgi:hypothetical protein